MTPKEKAKELVDKCKNYAYTNMLSFTEESNLKNSKKFAIITVEEILNLGLLYKQSSIEKGNKICLNTSQKEFWNKVKKEIQNI